MQQDHVDGIVTQWHLARPDVDVEGMAIIGRISRLERVIKSRLDPVFAKHGLEAWEFDVLATLRRSNERFQLTAGQLLDSMMITSGTMTNRIDRLQNRGLLQRAKDPADGRVVLVALTERGRDKIDAAIVDHAANELNIIDAISQSDQTVLIKILRRFHIALEAE